VLPRRALALAGAAALAGCTASPAMFAREIVGGVDDADDPAVVMWIAQVPGSPTATLCTATLISPHVVLTAAHCVLPELVGTNAKFSVFPGANVNTAHLGDFIDVTETHAHPDFSLNDVTGGSDIAVGILAKPLSPTPIAMNTTGLGNDLVGQPARMVGYGKSAGTDTTGATAGRKRQAATQLVSFTDKLVTFGMPGETTCEGDSGGPGLMTIGGVEVIVGVVSFGDAQCAQLGVDTRVDRFADSWVRPFVDMTDPGTLPPPSHHGCAMGGGGPAPASLFVLLVIGFRLARATRGGGRLARLRRVREGGDLPCARSARESRR
jgi:secreted trypsin-like serine protease